MSEQHSTQKMLSAGVRPVQANMPRHGSGSWKQQQQAAATSSKREREREREAESESAKSKKAKRKGGKACVYCRRSHMVCEGGRPCERCIKRDIAHLCRDVTPPASTGPPSAKKPEASSSSTQQQVKAEVDGLMQHGDDLSQQQQMLYDTGSSWPLLPDAGGSDQPLDLSAMSREESSMSGGGWGVAENAEFGILSDMLKTLRVPTLPGGFVDVLSQVVRSGNTQLPQIPNQPGGSVQAPASTSSPHGNVNGSGGSSSGAGTSSGGNGAQNGNAVAGPSSTDVKGKGKAEPFSSISRIEQYLLAAADQPDGSRASRLTQVIRAKYEAGLLKPYDYIKGYERMNRWMDSGRAARVDASRASSPAKGGPGPSASSVHGGRRLVVPPPPSGSSISPESRRRILAALEVFRPKFRRIAKELTDLDLVFVEEANERLMLQYDRALASIHTPSCIWRRTGEIQKANQEFAKLTGIPAPLFRNGQLCVYELMDEDSAVRFWEGYGKVAFEKGQSHMYTHCTLKIPLSLTRAQPARTQGNTPAAPGTGAPTIATSAVPDLSLPQAIASGGHSSQAGSIEDEYRVIKTCFSITIRRDRYDIPVAIMGQWIPIV